MSMQRSVVAAPKPRRELHLATCRNVGINPHVNRRVVPDDEPIWRALADPTRRAVLDILAGGPRTTGALASDFPTSRFTVMEHLKVLAEVGLVIAEKRGRERLHHLNPVPLQQVHERWVRPDAAAAAVALLRLDDHVHQRSEATTVPDTLTLGIDVRAEHRIGRDPAMTWTAILDLAQWWPRCWPDGEHLAFEPRLGGRLGTTPGPDLDSGGRLWGLVSELAPGAALALDGSMGLPGPVSGHWRMELAPDGAGTRVTVLHQVLGPVSDDDRAGFTNGWNRTLAHLAAHAGDL